MTCSNLIHDATLLACPFLPQVEVPLRASAMRRFGKQERGAEFYRAALQTGQSLWQRGLPAQALLQINRAMGADLDSSDPVLAEWPVPYAAASWIMRERVESQFIGNPRRHYQHLATRMIEPRKQMRVWRAWACWALACHLFPDMPADQYQIERDGIIEPSLDRIAEQLAVWGVQGEARLWAEQYAHWTA